MRVQSLLRLGRSPSDQPLDDDFTAYAPEHSHAANGCAHVIDQKEVDKAFADFLEILAECVPSWPCALPVPRNRTTRLTPLTTMPPKPSCTKPGLSVATSLTPASWAVTCCGWSATTGAPGLTWTYGNAPREIWTASRANRR